MKNQTKDEIWKIKIPKSIVNELNELYLHQLRMETGSSIFFAQKNLYCPIFKECDNKYLNCEWNLNNCNHLKDFKKRYVDNN
jgi:hypothetical protein